MEAYRGFKGIQWREAIDVNNFILENYTEYTGSESFLTGPTEATQKLWGELTEMFKEEEERGIYDAETRLPSQIDTYGPGYINQNLEDW